MAVEALSGLTTAYTPATATTNPTDPGHSRPAQSGGAATAKPDHITPKLVQAQPGGTDAKSQQDFEGRLKEATQALNDFMRHYSIKLQFNIEDDQTVVRVLNKETGEVIRQIPSEEAIRISKALNTLQGLIIQKKV